MKEKRKGTRFSFTSEVTVTGGKKREKGVIRDMSINGAYIKMNCAIKLFENVDIAIKLETDEVNLSASIKGIVSRKDNLGIGVQFKDLDYASFKTVRNIARIYAEDIRKIESEIASLNIKSITE